MNDSGFDLAADGRRRLDAYLDEVEQRLTGQGMDRAERRSVVDDIEAQAIEMLRARTPTPDLGDVQAVLEGLDKADAYARPEPPGPPASSVTGGIPPFVKVLLKVVLAMVVGLGLLGAVILFLLAAPAG